jgi:hypothetical protein
MKNFVFDYCIIFLFIIFSIFTFFHFDLVLNLPADELGLIDIEIWMNGNPALEQLLEIVPVLKYLKGVAEQFQAIEDDI